MGTAAEDVAKSLRILGVRQVFTLCADQTNGLLNALAAENIRIVGTRHESAAVLMADGWTRGDQASWEKQIHQRNQLQNEYKR